MKPLKRTTTRKLLVEYEALITKKAEANPTETQLLRNVVGALRGGYATGRLLSQGRQLARTLG
jgi:hypothetical protein